jgi:hypothetical protein
MCLMAVHLLLPTALLLQRMAMCRDKGFHAVEPDNIDGYANNNGLGLTAADQLDFNKWLANTAHGLGLAVGLKNDLEQVGLLRATAAACWSPA